MKKTPDWAETELKSIIDQFEQEDQSVRQRQVRMWKRLKLIWEGFQNTYYSEVAHDWRVWDASQYQDNDQAYYDKPINVFRAYLESIIAALSINIPPTKAFPDDADNALDLSTARAADKISELIYRHNDVSMLWLHSLFVYCTEGMVAAYNYSKEDEKYGTYKEPEYEDTEENHQISTCPNCGMEINDELLDTEKDEFDPKDDDARLHNIIFNEDKDICPGCSAQIDPEIKRQKLIITRLIGETTKPKSRVHIEAFGGLNVKVPNYAKKQSEVPILNYSHEVHYTVAREIFKDYDIDIPSNQQIGAGVNNSYEVWARLNPQYFGQFSNNVVTIRNYWLRPCAFHASDECERLQKKYPDGCKVVLVNDCFAYACNESLDDHWTLTYNPMSDYLTHDPLGMLLTSVQDITNDLISLTLQTIEHGIPQTFVSPDILNFTEYKQQETTPGALVMTKPSTGKSISDGFYEVKTATLSQEVMPFGANIQSLGQLASGALPTLFGGALEGTDTASEYAMSRQQALQRQGNVWKMFTAWWKNIFGKAIPMYIELVVDDERDVQQDDQGNFINVIIRKAELEGKIGRIELEASENLPLNYSQKKDVLMKLIELNNPETLAIIGSPENLPVLRELLGLNEMYIPGEDDVQAEYEAIKECLKSEPIDSVDPTTGQPIKESSVPIDPDFDNHQIGFEIDRKWIVSDAGRLARNENPAGYENVLLRGKAHLMMLRQAQMNEQVNQANGANPEKPNNQKPAPISGENDVKTQQ